MHHHFDIQDSNRPYSPNTSRRFRERSGWWLGILILLVSPAFLTQAPVHAQEEATEIGPASDARQGDAAENGGPLAEPPPELFDRRDTPSISGKGGAIPVRVVDGRLVIACDVSGTKLRAPANLWLDLDGPFGFQLHNRAAAALPAEVRGKPSPLKIHFPDFDLAVPRRELGPEEDFERFTKYHSKEIGENALSGAIGAQILKHFDVVLDLPRGEVSLLPPGGLAEYSEARLPGEVVTPITVQNDLVWLPVQLDSANGPLNRAFAIGSTRYDSLIDRRLCGLLKRPAGNIGPLRCEAIDFAPFVAFRPAEVVQVHQNGVAGIMGVNLLESFRIHIDRQTQLATLQSTGAPDYPKQDLVFFQAMLAEDPALVLDWLKLHAETRLGREAAELLLTLYLDEGAEVEDLSVAVQWVNDTMPKDLRATRLLDLMEELVNEGETDLGVVAGKLGVKSARADRYPESNYKLHGRLGELLLPSDNREAWRHLLSAAFGLPEDGMINLNLGRCYEASEKKARAFSRYIQALIKEESSELAMQALARMDAELPPDQRLTIERIDRLISGRVRNYSAPKTFEPDPKTRSNRTCLVEFFTNGYLGNERRGGAIGGALGNQGLISHFKPSECVFLSYHVPHPKVDPLVNPQSQHMAGWLGVKAPVVQLVDGKLPTTGVGRHRDAESVFESARDIVVKQLTIPTPIDISATAKFAEGRVIGNVVVSIKEEAKLPSLVVQVVVAERGVVFHGSSGVVIHRMLARGLATDSSRRGVEFQPDPNGKFEFDFSRSLADIQEENTNHLSMLQEGKADGGSRMGLRIEPKSLEVVVIVREEISGAVHQAFRIDLARPEDSQ